MASASYPNRRSVLKLLAALPAAAASACTKVAGFNAAQALARPQLIDAHCHLFNVTDLPAATFAQTVLLKDYPGDSGLTWRQRRLRDALLAIQRTISRRVPTASEEAAAIGLKAMLAPSALTAAEQEQLDRDEAEAESARPPAVEDRFKCERSTGFSPSIRSVREWYQTLRSPRASIAFKLYSQHAASGYSARLLCPALVDYSNWLGQELHSSLPDQIVMGGELARMTSLPAIHGYVAFDPLRRALFRTGKRTVDGYWDPLEWARKALVEHGYVGVKLYPPMGFRPSGNAGSGDRYPAWVREGFGTDEAAAVELDRSLDELWALCEELDAPLMAHCANSNASGSNYGRRADPAYWVRVAEQHPQLRIMLAHFGGFGTFSAAVPGAQCDAADEVPLEATWEGVIGAHLEKNPNSLLFADISYLSETFKPGDRKRAVERMTAYLPRDPGARHLVFGSDWVMLGIEKQYLDAYPRRVAEFLADCGLKAEQVEDVMQYNALRYLGLTRGSRAYQRLAAFYAAKGLSLDRLPVLEAPAEPA